MKHVSVLLFVAFSIFALTYCAETSEPPATEVAEETAAPAPTHEDTVKRGAYLVTLMGCHDCHSPKRMGPKGPEDIPELAYSGYQASNAFVMPNTAAVKQGWAMLNSDFTSFVGPWGVSFTANLTSDETGIGNWTFEQFKRALKEGKYKGLEAGRPLLPPMPWFNFVNAKDEDLWAMYSFFKSTKPVKNVVPPPIPPDQLGG